MSKILKWTMSYLLLKKYIQNNDTLLNNYYLKYMKLYIFFWFINDDITNNMPADSDVRAEVLTIDV